MEYKFFWNSTMLQNFVPWISFNYRKFSRARLNSCALENEPWVQKYIYSQQLPQGSLSSRAICLESKQEPLSKLVMI